MMRDLFFKKEVKTQNLCDFEFGSQETKNVPIWIIKGFQRRDTQDSQTLKSGTYCRLPVFQCQCIICTDKYPEAGKKY